MNRITFGDYHNKPHLSHYKIFLKGDFGNDEYTIRELFFPYDEEDMFLAHVDAINAFNDLVVSFDDISREDKLRMSAAVTAFCEGRSSVEIGKYFESRRFDFIEEYLMWVLMHDYDKLFPSIERFETSFIGSGGVEVTVKVEEDSRPQPIEDFGDDAIRNLVSICERHFDALVECDGELDNDDEHYIYEAVMEMVYGDDVFHWMNSLGE